MLNQAGTATMVKERRSNVRIVRGHKGHVIYLQPVVPRSAARLGALEIRVAYSFVTARTVLMQTET